MSTAIRPATGVDQVAAMTFGPGGASKFLDLLERPEGRIYYRDDRVTIVSPSFEHERGVVRLGDVVEEIAVELEIGFLPAGSTLYRRDDLGRGAMPDRSYSFEHRHAVRIVDGRLDLNASPPPDLVIEVVWTHNPAEALEIYGALGVPEVWLFDIPTANLRFLHLGQNGEYTPRPESRALPFVAPGEVLDQLRAAPDEEEHRWRRRVRAWARDVLGPRRAGGA